MLLFTIKAEEAELAEQGLTPDEIAEAMAGRNRPAGDSLLLDSLLGHDVAAERRRQLDAGDDEDDGDDGDEALD